MLGEGADQCPCRYRLDAILGQEGDPGGVAARVRKREVDDVAIEGVGDLDEDAGPVATVLLAAGGTAVRQVLERADCLEHQRVGCTTVQVGHESDTAGVMLEPRVVEPGGRGRGNAAGARGEIHPNG